MKRVLLIQGHPDRDPVHFGHALADAYANGAKTTGFDVSRIEVAALDFPLLHKKSDWDGPLPATLKAAQAAVGRANHIVLFFPLWLGTMPAVVKAFLEQILRPGFAFHEGDNTGKTWRKGLKGKSARIVVTMGMPALIYRWYFGAHGVKGLERNILRFCGVSPVRETYIGLVESSATARKKWLKKLHALGRAGR